MRTSTASTILTQVAAATKALHAVSLGLMDDHLAHCVAGAAAEAGTAGRNEHIEGKIREASEAIARLLR